MSGKYNFAIDRGGTFTDVLCICPDGRTKALKLLSEDPERYSDAPREGIRRILKQELGSELTSDGLVETSSIGWIRMGTTVATNALLQRTGAPVALIVNKGFKDLLYIGNQARPSIFDININKPSNLYSKVIEVDCRIVPAQENKCQMDHNWGILNGVSDTKYLEKCPVNETEIKSKLDLIFSSGIKSVAIVLAHSYACPIHEIQIGKIAKDIGFSHITLSHQAMPMIRLVARGYTACAEAYLTPHVDRYLSSFCEGFKNNLSGIDVLFMQSDGGLTKMKNFRGARAILSGPAGGVVGYAVTGQRDTKDPLIGFDMGGTSTDVSRFATDYEHVIESTTAGITIQAPQLDINTVAAGGGSMLFFRSGLFVVGPESAGAHPGPACYKKGGPLTVTDANLILGRLIPSHFPKIFGELENEPLSYEESHSKFEKISSYINNYLKNSGERTTDLTIQEVAMGFIKVANEGMCRPIRALTQSRGLDTSKHVLACFGGAGGQHACSIARELGMKKVLVHKYAGILSAYGMALADVIHEEQEPCELAFESHNVDRIKERLDALCSITKEKLKHEGFHENQITLQPYLHLRYDGTDCAIMCPPSQELNPDHCQITDYGDFMKTFLQNYLDEFGFIIQGRTVKIDNIRVRGSGKMCSLDEQKIPIATQEPAIEITSPVYFEQDVFETPVYLYSNLYYGHKIKGPAILINNLSTILIEPNCHTEMNEFGDLIIHINDESAASRVDETLNAVQLSIFSHRFMSIAEQMGRVLQRTSISTNIKERLDFSCALFGPDGGLVSNAPHIPVHLGAMQETVKYQIKVRKNTLKVGDVLLSNHPIAGGSHLPDLTVITPVFHKDLPSPIFYVASRGHHADIGGITPGSMPPHSKSLLEEGVAFKSFLIVAQGVFRENEIIKEFITPTEAPNACGTRNLADNLSDLKAQIAANKKGIQLVTELIDYYGLRTVQAYMNYIQENAELAVRDMMRDIAKRTKEKTGSCILEAEQFMDDGTPIKLKINIDEINGSATFDFTGTGYEVWGNCNAPRAITFSAIIYCLRCMVGYDIPLNQGCLKPITIIIPKNSILDPSDNAAVVGGNVLTSQRIVDTVFLAFEVCAASQGCMNNITIGDEQWGYYETVAGGSGAGPTWHGTGGVHTHMTNTRITDPEILESRYPIILNKFCLREDNSGGSGLFTGGEGVQRELLFRKPVMLSVLTERRVIQPYGLNGGGPGKRGVNLLIKNDGSTINLGGKAAINVETGDKFSMVTPGGGGYGIGNKNNETQIEPTNLQKQFIERGSVFEYRMSQETV